MRYTTIIDLSELPAVYRNRNARLLYLHLCLKCGYHDDDRDIMVTSLRRLSADVGLTLSATRFAIGQLEANDLVSREGDRWRVRKWLMSPEITKRVAKKQQQEADADASLARKFDEQAEENKRRAEEKLERLSTRELQEWVKELERGDNEKHHGISLKPCDQNIEYLKSILKRR